MERENYSSDKKENTIDFALPGLADYKYALDKSAIVAITDRKGKITYVNSSFCEISKYTVSELIGKDHRIINSGHHPKEFMRNLWQTIQSGNIWKGEIKNRARDGSYYWVDTTIIPFLDTDGNIYQYAALRFDITSKKEQGEKLQKYSKEINDYKLALDKAAIVAITNRMGEITYVNQSFCDISKYSQEELIGQDHRIINSGYHKKEFIRNLWKTIQQGKIWKGEIKNKAKDGTYYWVDTTIVPFTDEKGVPIQHLAIRFDITRKKEQELELRKSKIKLEYINENLQQFAHTVSHDLKSPINGLLGMMDLMDYKLKELKDKELEEYVGIIRKNATYMKELINGILEYSKADRSEYKIEEIDAGKETDYVISVQPSRENVTINRNGTVGVINYNKACFHQILSNLISNGLKYCDKKETIISVHLKEEDHQYVITVSDNGPGIPEDKKYYIFELFSSLEKSRSASNTGIGLATTKRIVEALGGSIWVESKLGEGSDFHFSIKKRP